MLFYVHPFSPTLTAIEVKDSVMCADLRVIVGFALSFLLAASLSTAQAPEPAPASGSRPLKVERDTKLELVLVEPVSSATTRKGQTIRMELSEPWIVEGKVVLPRGAPATGVVYSVQHAVPGKKSGHVAVVNGSLQLPSGKEVPLSLSMPDYWDCDGTNACTVYEVLGSVVIVPLLAIDFVAHPKGTLNSLRGDSNPPNTGLDSDVPAGSRVRAWTKRSFELPQTNLPVAAKVPAASAEPPCKAAPCAYQINLEAAP